MVRVITIRDDVYAELYRLKKPKGMSFSQIIEYLIKEKQGKMKDIVSFAGSVDKDDLDRKTFENVKKEFDFWGR
ncbi:MAG: antitoxin VapB family protein [Candidatus ainarchaeum sp.]|nr:antitoxin VapB family protein [Candidatus ainarchaeum sp.]